MELIAQGFVMQPPLDVQWHDWERNCEEHRKFAQQFMNFVQTSKHQVSLRAYPVLFNVFAIDQYLQSVEPQNMKSPEQRFDDAQRFYLQTKVDHNLLYGCMVLIERPPCAHALPLSYTSAKPQ